MLTRSEFTSDEPYPLFLSNLQTEGQAMKPTHSECNLWNAVLLQLLKESEHIKRDIGRTSEILNDSSQGQKQREIAFIDHVKAQENKREMHTYIKTQDFETICDFAGHNVTCVVSKMQDVLDGKTSISDRQVKRTFTRKKNLKRKA